MWSREPASLFFVRTNVAWPHSFCRLNAAAARSSAPTRKSKRKDLIHANATDCPGPCRCDRRHWRRYLRIVAGISRNLGTADGLHARRLAPLRRPDPRCQPDRGVLAAEHAAALQWLPRGVRIAGRRAAAVTRTAAKRATCPRPAAGAAAGGTAAADAASALL